MSIVRSLCAAGLLLGFAAGTAEALARVVTPPEMRRVVDVRDVSTVGPMVRGRVVNLTDSTLEDITLLVEDHFLWRDEFHPGDVSPGRAEVVRIERVPPRGAVDFTFERGELPSRADGRFETSVQVLGLTERPPVGAGAATAPPTVTIAPEP